LLTSGSDEAFAFAMMLFASSSTSVFSAPTGVANEVLGEALFLRMDVSSFVYQSISISRSFIDGSFFQAFTLSGAEVVEETGAFEASGETPAKTLSCQKYFCESSFNLPFVSILLF
jgi:hypothetical protein